MEGLHDLLVGYNKAKIPLECRRSWSVQFCEQIFPSYWYKVYDILNVLDRHERIIEIGCGQGDITSIACYLGFSSVVAYERDSQMSRVAIDKIKVLFDMDDVIITENFPAQKREDADILIMVNCVYADGSSSKEEYMQKIKLIHKAAGSPKRFIFEAIDPSYKEPDSDLLYQIRLSQYDVKAMFLKARIASWETYKYPYNKKTKCLYLIEQQ